MLFSFFYRIVQSLKKRLSLKTAVYLLLTFLMNNHGNYKTGSAEISGAQFENLGELVKNTIFVA